MSWISGKGWNGDPEEDWGGVEPVVSKNVYIKLTVNLIEKDYIISTGYLVNEALDLEILRSLDFGELDFSIKGVGR